MKTTTRRIGTLGAAILALALPAVAPAQYSKLTRDMGIDQKLGASVPKDALLRDESGVERSFGSVLKGRPVLVVPMVLKCQGGCHLLLDGLQKTLFRAAHPNDRKLVKKTGPNRLGLGRDLDVVVLSLDPRERPADAQALKAAFQKQLGDAAGPLTVFTGSLSEIHKVTNAVGFRYFFDPKRDVLNNATGSVLLTPDGRASSYTIGNNFQTVELETNLDTAKANAIGDRADDSEMFGCIQLDRDVLARRKTLESLYTGAGVVTLVVVAGWIGLMLRSERNRNRDLGGQPGGA